MAEFVSNQMVIDAIDIFNIDSGQNTAHPFGKFQEYFGFKVGSDESKLLISALNRLVDNSTFKRLGLPDPDKCLYIKLT